MLHTNRTLADSLVNRLDEDQCWTRLQHSETGRFVVVRDGRAEIRPVNYIVADRSVVLATSSELLVDAARRRLPVVFEVDEHDGWTAWSVIVRGTAEATLVEDRSGRQQVRSMLATPKSHLVRIVPTEMSGRLFDQAH